MAISFYLLRKSNPSSSIMITISYNNVIFKAATGLTCNPCNWSSKNYKVNKNEPKHLFINYILGEYTQQINKELINLQFLNVDTDVKILKNVFENLKRNLISKSKQIKDKNGTEDGTIKDIMMSHFEKFIAARSEDPNFSLGIVKNYKKNFKHLKNYIEKKRLSIEYENIDNDFYTKFIKYLSSDLKLQRNTVGNIIKTLKTFLNWSFNEGFHSTTKYVKVLKVWKERSDTIVLDDDEIRKIEEVDLRDNPGLSKARDIFLICLFTGFRFGDYNKIQPAHIDKKKRIIKLITNKTKDPVGVPIDLRLEKIILKYTDLNLPKMSNQKANEYIKKVAEKSGITEDIIKVYRMGNETQEIAIRKNELISMHTARRTWNTRAEKSKRNTFAIMRATGHKNINVHGGYVKYDLDDAIEEMRGLWD